MKPKKLVEVLKQKFGAVDRKTWLSAGRAMIPALVIAVVMLGFAGAPALQEVPELLEPAKVDAAVTPEGGLGADLGEKPETPAEETVDPADKVQKGTGHYTDGTHTGTGYGYGGPIKVQVKVAEGQITDVSILSAAGETSAYLNRAKGVIGAIVKAQTWSVDAVSGATLSSNGIKSAVENALTGKAPSAAAAQSAAARAKAAGKGGNKEALKPVAYEEPKDGLQDGTYSGSAQGYGGAITVNTTITDGKIAQIAITSAAGETRTFLEKAKKVIDTIIEKQSPEVDAVSGATYSSSGIINAVKKSLAKAGNQPEPEEEAVTPPEQTEKPEEQAAQGSTESDDNQQAETPSTPDEKPDEAKPSGESEENGGMSGPADEPDPEAGSEREETPSAEASEPQVVTSTETITSKARVYADEYQEFDDYDIALSVVLETVTTTKTEGSKVTVTTMKTVKDCSVSTSTDSYNQGFLNTAFAKIKKQFLEGRSASQVDAVSGASCSSAGLKDAWKKAMEGIKLGVTETVSEK